MTDKEIFETVSEHLLDQGCRAFDCAGDCKYRSPDGRMCAIGCLISDEAYTPTMEGAAISESGVLVSASQGHDKEALERALTASGIEKSQYRLLGKLQKIHDQTYPGDWAGELQILKLETFGK